MKNTTENLATAHSKMHFSLHTRIYSSLYYFILGSQCSITLSCTGTKEREVEQVVDSRSCLNCDSWQKGYVQETKAQGLNHPLAVPISLL